MANKKLNINTVDDYIKLLKDIPKCEKAVAWLEKYRGQSVDVLLSATTDSDHESSWTVWALQKIGEKYSQADRLHEIAKIQDPATAFHLYTELPWLTDKDDELLLSKFKGKLPTAEAELAQGIVKRKKS
jgi:hypothetical protein